jgi:toxin ParE1/3/4
VKLLWSSRANKDLCAIGDFIAKDNPKAARSHIEKLIKKARRAARFPNSGRIVPEIGNEAIREIIEGHYRIVYALHPKAKSITILTVFESHKQIRL